MKKKIFIGIDVSNVTLDLCVKTEKTSESFVIKNDVRSIKGFFRKVTGCDIAVGMENTGRYNWALYEFLAEWNHEVFVIAPLHLKKSMGLVRGKNDKVDALRIAEFLEKNHSDLKPWFCPSLSIQKLKILMAERSFRQKFKRGLLSQQWDYKKMKRQGLNSSLQKMNAQLIAKIEKQILEIERQIEETIQQDDPLKKQANLMRTIPGVGKVLCWMMLAKTQGFTTIQDPRKMACYSGVAPFDYQSGTSIKGRKRVSVFADKAIKSVLHLSAMRAVRLKNDLNQYYERKVSEGKNKMSVLNAVRNKIIHRIFAVIKSEIPYKICLDLS